MWSILGKDFSSLIQWCLIFIFIRKGNFNLTQLTVVTSFKVVSSEFYFHKPITVHIELYLFYRFIHFLLYIGQY